MSSCGSRAPSRRGQGPGVGVLTGRVGDAARVDEGGAPAVAERYALVARTRQYVLTQMALWGISESAFTAELVVSELVTNAIRHGAPPIQLRLVHDDTTLICEVSDGSGTAPHLRRAKTFDEGGRGLLLVAQLTQRWGSRHTEDGKTIWAELAPSEE